jgi:predicted transcriptional regulator
VNKLPPIVARIIRRRSQIADPVTTDEEMDQLCVDEEADLRAVALCPATLVGVITKAQVLKSIGSISAGLSPSVGEWTLLSSILEDLDTLADTIVLVTPTAASLGM